jgi:hypothetical protein
MADGADADFCAASAPPATSAAGAGGGVWGAGLGGLAIALRERRRLGARGASRERPGLLRPLAALLEHRDADHPRVLRRALQRRVAVAQPAEAERGDLLERLPESIDDDLSERLDDVAPLLAIVTQRARDHVATVDGDDDLDALGRVVRDADRVLLTVLPRVVERAAEQRRRQGADARRLERHRDRLSGDGRCGRGVAAAIVRGAATAGEQTGREHEQGEDPQSHGDSRKDGARPVAFEPRNVRRATSLT